MTIEQMIVAGIIAIVANGIAIYRISREERRHAEQLQHSMAKMDEIDRRRLKAIKATEA